MRGATRAARHAGRGVRGVGRGGAPYSRGMLAPVGGGRDVRTRGGAEHEGRAAEAEAGRDKAERREDVHGRQPMEGARTCK